MLKLKKIIPVPKVNYLLLLRKVQYWTRSQLPHGLTRSFAAARLLRLWVRIPPEYECLSVVSVVCCQVEVCATSWSLVPEKSYRLWYIVVCDLETSGMMRPLPARGPSREKHTKGTIQMPLFLTWKRRGGIAPLVFHIYAVCRTEWSSLRPGCLSSEANLRY